MIFLLGEYDAYDQTCNPYAVESFGYDDGYFIEILVGW